MLVCLSPAQRELYHKNNAPDHLLDLHNKFVDRRGYHEFTDDEVTAINFRESVTARRASDGDILNGKPKDDNRLLALIREINQLTTTPVNETPTNMQASQSPSHSDHASSKMSRSTHNFNNKRFSNYFDELSRLHPIVEETPRVYTNIESSNYQSRKRIENGQTVYEYSDSSHEKSSNNVPIGAPPNNYRPFHVNIGKSQFTANDAFRSNAEKRSCTAPSKNSQPDESVRRENDNESAQQCKEALDTNRSRFFFKEFDFVPKIFSNFFRSNKSEAECTSESVIESSERTVHIHTEKSDESRNSVSPLPLRKTERHSSTHSLYDSYGVERVAIPDRPPSVTNLTVRHLSGSRGRISPNPIRAPRLADSPKESSHPKESTSDAKSAAESTQRHYDWQTTKQSQNFENRQSMIDQTPISRHLTHEFRRMSLPKMLADNQLAYILEKERQISVEFDKLENDRLRLLKELEEMQVNQSVEDFCKQHKKRNSILPPLTTVSEEELLKKRMQEEWLSKVAEREERRLAKIIKVTHSTEVTPTYKSHTNRGLGDEFLERVKERRCKLQMPSDSDWDSGAESQPAKREHVSPHIDPTVKVLDDGCETDIKTLPKHLKEFAEFTTTQQQCDAAKSEPKEIIHKIERCDREDGESSVDVRLTAIGV